MKKVKELDVSDTKARGRRKEEEEKKVVKSARRPKEGDVQLLRELTAGDWAWRRRRVDRRGVEVRKRKWDQVITLNEHDQDGENEEDEEGNEDEEQGEEEEGEEEHQEQEYKRRKLNWPEEEEEFLVSDPITKLNPILDRCHITN
jgi:hypothetical protein